MDLLTNMRVFCRVVEIGSFSSVAAEFKVAQPTISKRVVELETSLNAKLLHRSTRQLSLTEVGAHYYEHCLRILHEIDETHATINELQAQPQGKLRVNIPVAFGRLHIIPHLWEFLALYPGIDLELILNDRFVNLVEEGVDLAIRVGPLSDLNLQARRIGSTPQVTIGSPDYFKIHGIPQTPAELKQHNCLRYTLLTTQNEWHFNGPHGLEKIRINGRFSANYSEAIRDAVKHGLGIAVLPTWLLGDDLHNGVYQSILTDYPPNPLDIHAVFPFSRYTPLKLRCFIEYFDKKYRHTGLH